MLSKFKMSSVQCIDWLSIHHWCSIFNTQTHTRSHALTDRHIFIRLYFPYSVFPRFFQFMAVFIGYRYLLLSCDTLMDRRKWLLIGWGRGANADWVLRDSCIIQPDGLSAGMMALCLCFSTVLSCRNYPMVLLSYSGIFLRQKKQINCRFMKFELWGNIS